MQLRDFSRTGGRIIGLFVLFLTVSSWADNNSWIKPTSGDWQDTNSWSLGILPDSSQSVQITNAGTKTVEINAATAQNHPNSLSVSNVLVQNPNTLWLNNIGTNVPFQCKLRAWNSGAVLMENSAHIGGADVEGGGNFIQQGGFLDGGVVLAYGHYAVTNGIVRGGVNLIIGSLFTQHASDVSGPVSLTEGAYNQYAGTLTAASIDIRGRYGFSGFNQNDGTNYISGNLDLRGVAVGASYRMNGGLLCTSNVNVIAGTAGTTQLQQTGGVHIVTNTITIQGESKFPGDSQIPAIYGLQGAGMLSARFIFLDGHLGVTLFNQADGTTIVSESIQCLGAPYAHHSVLSLQAGTLICSNFLFADGPVNVTQSGGSFIVSNLFSFGGYFIAFYSNSKQPAQYNFSGGTLSACNIELAAEWIIGSSGQTGRVTNPGYFKMAGILCVGDANEQLGRFILASNATIDLGNGDAKLSFVNSSAENWTNAAILVVTNWSGSPTGGGNDQLRFGSDASGLTASQLNQIRFVNPAGFSPGEYFALSLNTGEIVPAPRPTLSFGKNGTNFVLSWTGSFSLQTATNVIGPYEDLVGATSPYTNTMQTPERYFRLRE